MRAMTELMNLLILNLLTLLCSIPIVTAGAALSAMHYILLQMIEQEEGAIVKTYFKQFRSNLRDATLPYLALLLLSLLLFVNYRIFGADPDRRMLVIPAYIGAALVAMIAVWLFPLLAKFSNSFTANFRNAFLLAVGNFPRTIAMMAIMAVIPFVLTQVTALFPLLIFFGISLPSYLCTFLYRGVIQKLVKQALGEADEGEAEAEAEGEKTAGEEGKEAAEKEEKPEEA